MVLNLLYYDPEVFLDVQCKHYCQAEVHRFNKERDSHSLSDAILVNEGATHGEFPQRQYDT